MLLNMPSAFVFLLHYLDNVSESAAIYCGSTTPN